MGVIAGANTMTEHADIQTPGVKLGEKPPRVSEGIERFFAALVMGTLCVITFANVVVRYLTNFSFAFTEEYSVALMVILTLIGTAAAFAGDRHIRLTFLTEKLPLPARRRLEYFILAVSLGIFLAIAVLGFRLARDHYRFEEMTPGLGNPLWIYTIWLPLLSSAVCLRIIGRFIRVARSGR